MRFWLKVNDGLELEQLSRRKGWKDEFWNFEV